MVNADPSDVAWTEAWIRRASSGRGRRQSERLMTYWEQKLQELGGAVTIAGLDLSSTNSRDWSNRFLISVDPVIERSALLLYGPEFARLLNLPEQPRMDRPMMRQLPQRYVDLFLRACADAQTAMAPVRLEGEMERADGRIEQYRAVFIPVGVKPNSLTCFAFGAFSSRVIEPAGAAP
jgi:hypothetical protein